MKGSIRAIFGLILTIAAAGGLDNATDSQLIPCILVAGVGLAIMASGVRAMNRV